MVILVHVSYYALSRGINHTYHKLMSHKSPLQQLIVRNSNRHYNDVLNHTYKIMYQILDHSCNKYYNLIG